MRYKLFIDDQRVPVDDSDEWRIVRSSDEARRLVISTGVPCFISFDHDLGGEDTAMVFVDWLINAHLDGIIQNFPEAFDVHSQNPIGARNIRMKMQAYMVWPPHNVRIKKFTAEQLERCSVLVVRPGKIAA